jgi:Na+-transporting methylmalonyl-CoA/oxaloacetate decarboxylase beta subunit
MNEAYSIGIIGGADGPTAIFVTGRFPWEIALAAAALIAIVIWFVVKRK